METNDGKLPLVIMSGGTGSRMNMPAFLKHQRTGNLHF